jgi:OOP family OmpA-OmpF porin
MMQPGKWWIGLLPLAILVTIAATMTGETIEADIAGRARSALARVATPQTLADASVAVDGRDVAISGTALSREAAPAVAAEIAKEDGVRVVIDKTAAPGLAKPFVLSLERRGKALALSGNVPPGARETLHAAAAAKGFALADEAAYAFGAPENFDALAVYAIAVLDALGDGELILSDASLTASGAAASFDAYDQALAALRSPPAGVAVKAVEVTAPRVAPFVWSAAKSGALVSLFGYAPSPAVHDALVSEAASLEGATTLADQSRVASGAPAEFAAAARAALRALERLENGRAALADNRLSIAGAGKPNVASASVAAQLRAALPKGFELGEVEVAAGIVSPYVFTARKQDGVLALSGYAPNAATHAQLVTLVRKRFGGEIADEIGVAAGAPPGFDRAADAALRAVTRLRTGAAAISDRRVAIEGAAFTARAAEEIKARLARETPEGFESSALLGVASPEDEIAPAELHAAVAKTIAPGFAFSADHSALAEDALPVADALAFLLLRSPGAAVDIIGRFDGAGSEAENEAIGRRRAAALRDYLVAAGVAAARLTAAGSGGASGGDAPARRIELMVK